MEQFLPSFSNMSGLLLAAHPALLDPNFKRRVVLVSSHSSEEGALGVILNWPLRKTLGEFDPAYHTEPLGRVQIYRGGPVATNELFFAAWQWKPEEALFKFAFGIDHQQARSFLGEPGYEVRAFLGCSGWGEGQLEEEMAQKTWMMMPVDGEMLTSAEGADLWKEVITTVSPEMRVLAEAPDDPSLN